MLEIWFDFGRNELGVLMDQKDLYIPPHFRVRLHYGRLKKKNWPSLSHSKAISFLNLHPSHVLELLASALDFSA